jgi:hypothetical protein
MKERREIVGSGEVRMWDQAVTPLAFISSFGCREWPEIFSSTSVLESGINDKQIPVLQPV